MAKNKTVVIPLYTLVQLIAEREKAARLDELGRIAPIGGKLIKRRISEIKKDDVTTIMIEGARRKSPHNVPTHRYMVLNDDNLPSEFANLRQFIVREKD